MEQQQSQKENLPLQESLSSASNASAEPSESTSLGNASSGGEGIGEKKTVGSRVKSAWAPVAIALALIFYLIANRDAFSGFFGGIVGLLNPILWGAFVAYLCNPVLRFWERRVLKNISSFHVRRMLGIVLTYLFVILVVAVFGLILVPSLVGSIRDLMANFENYIADAVTYINNFAAKIMEAFPSDSTDEVKDFISVDTILEAVRALISNAGDIFSLAFDYIANYASQLISGVTDVILAVCISFYLLSSKELRLAQTRKLITAFCTPKLRTFVFKTTSMIHNTFGRYFQGVILDALIVFVVSLIVFSIMNIPNTIMISFIIAVTNVIPVFGPFLGAIPSAFIIFIIDPAKTIPFVIAILIMQQIDGNIIAPRILGESTGISSLCVVVSLAIMGGLWGIFGMVVGVPVFAVLVTLIRQAAESKLTKKNLSAELDDYYVTEAESTKASSADGTIQKKRHRLLTLWHRVLSYLQKGWSYAKGLGLRALGHARYVTALMVYRCKDKKTDKNGAKKPKKESFLPDSYRSSASVAPGANNAKETVPTAADSQDNGELPPLAPCTSDSASQGADHERAERE